MCDTDSYLYVWHCHLPVCVFTDQQQGWADPPAAGRSGVSESPAERNHSQGKKQKEDQSLLLYYRYHVRHQVVSRELLLGTEIPEGWGRGRLCLTLHCHHQNDCTLRWASMRAILMFHSLWGAKSLDCVHKPQHFKREASQSGMKMRSFWLPAWHLTVRPGQLTHLFKLCSKAEWSLLRFAHIRGTCTKLYVSTFKASFGNRSVKIIPPAPWMLLVKPPPLPLSPLTPAYFSPQNWPFYILCQ